MTIEIGENAYNRYSKHYEKIDHVNSLHDKKQLSDKKHTKVLNKQYDKLYNLTKDLHFKSAKLLSTQFKTIQIGKISTKSIVSNENNLNKISKRCMYGLSHFLFRERLKFQCQKRNSICNVVDESYTTKTCCMCKKIQDIGKSKIYDCENCGCVIDRDINASRNIFFK